MYTQAGWYNMGGKLVWVQKYLTYGLMYWTPETGWLELSSENEKEIVFVGINEPE